MNESPDRVQQFKADIADMRVRDPATALDRVFIRLGPLGMAVGIGLGVIAYFMSHGTDKPLQQRDAIILALIGLAVVVVSAAVYVKAALTGFLRFWMARLCYEQQAQADRVVATVRPRANTDAEVGS